MRDFHTFVFSQAGPVLTGRVLVLGTDAVPVFAATIGVDGDVTAPGFFTGQTNITGSISTIVKTASVGE